MKKITNSEKVAYLGNREVDANNIEAEIAKVREGRDAPMTEQIFGETKAYMGDAKQALFIKDGEIRPDDDPLIEFIELYQPGVMVERQKFYRRLLDVLEGWK
jgi:hypothetical protein